MEILLRGHFLSSMNATNGPLDYVGNSQPTRFGVGTFNPGITPTEVQGVSLVPVE